MLWTFAEIHGLGRRYDSPTQNYQKLSSVALIFPSIGWHDSYKYALGLEYKIWDSILNQNNERDDPVKR